MRSVLIGLVSAVFASLTALGAGAQPLPAGVAAASHPVLKVGSPDFSAFLDGLAKGQMEAEGVPGLAVEVVTRDGVRVARTYGFGAGADGKPLVLDPEHSVLPIASMSKSFIAVALMRAEEKGLLNLDDPANKYLDFKLPTFPNSRPITLRDLARHEAGFEERWLATGAWIKPDPRPWSTIMAKTYPRLISPPGSYASYSNYGAALLGYILQRVSGKPYAEYLHDEVFAPLGMTSSSIEDPAPRELADRVVSGWIVSGGVLRNNIDYNNVRTAPAGRVKTTLADMANYMSMLMNDGRKRDGSRFLSHQSIATLFTPISRINPLMPGVGVIFTEKDLDGIRFVGHGGDGGDRHTDMEVSPREGLGIFVIFLSAPGPEARDRFNRALVSAVLPDARTSFLPLPTVKRDLSGYAGEYRHYRWAFTTIEKVLGLSSEFTILDSGKGTLIVKGRLGGGEYVPVVQQGNLFKNRLTGELLCFTKSWDGRQNVNLSMYPFVTAFKLQPYDTQNFNFAAYWIFVVALTLFGLIAVAQSIRDAFGGAPVRAAGGLVLGLPLVSCGVGLWYFVTAASAMSELDIQHTIPALAYWLLAIPPVSLGMLLIYVGGLVHGAFRPAQAIGYGLPVSALMTFAGFVAFLLHWNAFGWNFP